MGDTREPLNNLTNCEDAIAAFEQATGHSQTRPAQPQMLTGTVVAPPPIPPSGRRQASRSKLRSPASRRRPGRCAGGLDGALLVARRWLAARNRRSPLPALRRLSLVVAYTRQTSALCITADSHAGHATRRRLLVHLSPATAADVARALRPQPTDFKFEIGLWLVTGPGSGPVVQRRFE